MLRRGPLPIYYQILQNVRRRIAAGDFPNGSQLPTDEDLMQEFGVSRQTVRTALQHLVSDGIIERRPGRGSFVIDRPIGDNSWTIRAVDDLVNDQRDVRREIVYAGPVGLNDYPDEAYAFQASGDEELFMVRAVRYIAEGPHAVAHMLVPTSLASRLPNERFADTAVIKLIEDHCRVRAHRARVTAAAERAGKETASLLQVQPGEALLVLNLTFYTREGQTIQHTRAVYRSDRYPQVLELYRDSRPRRAH